MHVSITILLPKQSNFVVHDSNTCGLLVAIIYMEDILVTSIDQRDPSDVVIWKTYKS